jgi:hypothetical protein
MRYVPTSTELVLTLGSFALLGLMIFVFTKIFPSLPVWEIVGVRQTQLKRTPLVTLKKVFTGWLAGITVSSIFTVSWVILTIYLAGSESPLVYSVRLNVLQPPLLSSPGPLTTMMTSLLFIVAFAGLIALAGRPRKESY